MTCAVKLLRPLPRRVLALACLLGGSVSLAGTLWLLLKLGVRNGLALVLLAAAAAPVHLAVGCLCSLAFDTTVFVILLLHWRLSRR